MSSTAATEPATTSQRSQHSAHCTILYCTTTGCCEQPHHTTKPTFVIACWLHS